MEVGGEPDRYGKVYALQMQYATYKTYFGTLVASDDPLPDDGHLGFIRTGDPIV